MLAIERLNSFGSDAVQAIMGLEKHFLIVSESHLRKRLLGLKPHESPILVILMPTASAESPNPDSLRWQNQLMFLVLKGPINYTKRNLQEELDDFSYTQTLVMDLLSFFQQKQALGSCTWLKYLDLNSLQVDPEYNLHSCDGWSVTLNVKTHGS